MERLFLTFPEQALAAVRTWSPDELVLVGDFLEGVKVGDDHDAVHTHVETKDLAVPALIFFHVKAVEMDDTSGWAFLPGLHGLYEGQHVPSVAGEDHGQSAEDGQADGSRGKVGGPKAGAQEEVEEEADADQHQDREDHDGGDGGGRLKSLRRLASPSPQPGAFYTPPQHVGSWREGRREDREQEVKILEKHFLQFASTHGQGQGKRVCAVILLRVSGE